MLEEKRKEIPTVGSKLLEEESIGNLPVPINQSSSGKESGRDENTEKTINFSIDFD
jgi:hypothetical protein